MPVEALDLTVRSYNCLKREGIHTVGELITRSEADLMDIRNFGAKSIDEVKEKLQSMGIALKDSPPGFDPSQYASAFDDDDYDEDEIFLAAPVATEAVADESDDDQSFAEDEQL
jgi:DNA-directed RNA polymerase subunit alpha